MGKKKAIIASVISAVALVGVIILIIVLFKGKKKDVTTTARKTTNRITTLTTTKKITTKKTTTKKQTTKVPTYNVKFVDYDGELLEEQYVKKGEKPYYIPDNLNRVVFENRIYRLNFIGWDKKIDVINQDTTYTATYEKTEMDIYIDGNDYYFGYYPQSLETDESIINTLNDEAEKLPTSSNYYNWTNYYDYYSTLSSDSNYKFIWYIDIDVDGDELFDYRGVYFTNYMNITGGGAGGASNQSIQGLETNHVYWYKYEVLKWKKVGETNDGNDIILSDLIIDSQRYCAVNNGNSFAHNDGYGPSSSYDCSDIRIWLNEYFYNCVFTDSQKEIINLSIVKCYQGHTYDYIYLLDRNEVTDYLGIENAGAIVSDYAVSQNADLTGSGATEYRYGEWWLRDDSSSGSIKDGGHIVTNNSLEPEFTVVKTHLSSVGVRPVLALGEINYDLCTLTTHSDGNNGRITKYKNRLFDRGDTVTLTARPYTGYKFDGWYDGEEKVSSSMIYSFVINKNMSLTAKWALRSSTDKNIYVTTYNENPTAGNITEYNDQGFDENSTITLIAEPKDGYEFVGWYDGETQVSTDLEYTFTPDEDTLIIAKWKEVNDDGVYTITTVNEHPEFGTITAYENVEFAAKSSIPLEVEVNENIDYVFIGWYDGETLLSSKIKYIYAIDKDIIITAKWDLKKFSITTINDNSTAGSITIYTNEMFYINSSVTLTATVNETSGYTFGGWYAEGVRVTPNEVYTFTVTKDITLTARWTYYTVTTKPFFGDGSSNPARENYYVAGTFTTLDNQKVTVGTKITLEAQVRDGSTWVCWYDLTNDTKLSDDKVFEYEMSSKNVVICAKYKLYKYTNAFKTIVQFGYYPQTEVTDPIEIGYIDYGMLPEPGNSYKWTDYGYLIMGVHEEYSWYIDIDIDEDGLYDYRGVYFTQRRPIYTYSRDFSPNAGYDNRYYKEEVYWFKYEPITWYIIEENNTGKFAFANMSLDGMQFYHDVNLDDHEMEFYPNDYYHSEIRGWLNDNFINTAFDAERQKLIAITSVSGSPGSTTQEDNPYACQSSSDKIFLLSRKEYINKVPMDFKLSSATDYAIAQHIFRGEEDYINYFSYWLRSPYVDDPDYGQGTLAWIDSGTVFGNSKDAYNVGTLFGVRPAANFILNV